MIRTVLLACLSALAVAVAPLAAAAEEASAAALRETARRAAAGEVDAEARIACAQEAGEALGACTARVARDAGGTATVIVTFPNGFARRLFFVEGRFSHASATMSGTGRRDLEAELRADGLHHLRVDDQRYRVPDRLLHP